MSGEKTIDRMQPGDEIQSVLLLKEKTLASSRAGKKYMTLVLSDRTGQIEGKLWDDAESVDAALERLNPVRIEGTVSLYREKPQITVRGVAALKWTQDLYSRLMPASKFERTEMEERLGVIVSSIKDPDLQGLVRRLMDDRTLWDRFASVPAAKQIHHAYLRGLLEHTLSMMEIGATLAEHYDLQFPGLIDRDLVIVGALIHDLGKSKEYEYEQGIDISTEGRFIGHVVLGVEILGKALEGMPDFPVLLAQRLKHMVVSHHGDLEYGAPVKPVTPEALLLHQVDLLDSQINAMASVMAGAGDEMYSPFSQKFDRRFFNPRSSQVQAERPQQGQDKRGTKIQAEMPQQGRDKKTGPKRKDAVTPEATAAPEKTQPAPHEHAKVEVAKPSAPLPASDTTRQEATRPVVPPAPSAPKPADPGGDVWEKEIPAEAPAPVAETAVPGASETVGPDSAETTDEGAGADRTGTTKKKKRGPSMPELF